jgi:hypothetical protein
MVIRFPVPTTTWYWSFIPIWNFLWRIFKVFKTVAFESAVSSKTSIEQNSDFSVSVSENERKVLRLGRSTCISFSCCYLYVTAYMIFNWLNNCILQDWFYHSWLVVVMPNCSEAQSGRDPRPCVHCLQAKPFYALHVIKILTNLWGLMIL